MSERKWFREYCEKSTSPCMEYFVMKQRSLIELFFWLLIFLLMISITFTSMSSLINVWINNPTVMFIENTESGISEIPFPKITICPSNQIRKSVWERYKNTNSSYWGYLQQYQSLVCSSHFVEFDNSSKRYFSSDMIRSLVNDCAISCSELFQSMDVKWQNRTMTNFCSLIQPYTTNVGLCYAFNMMPSYQLFNDEYSHRYMHFYSKNNPFIPTIRSQWNLDHGYASYPSDNIQEDVFPARTSGVSYYHRLKFRLNAMNDDFLRCPNDKLVEGFFLIIYSNPVDIYSVKRSFVVPDTYMKVQIKPYVKKMNPDLLWRSSEVRKCYLHNERKLSIFQHYTENNCNVECMLNETLSMCGCITNDMAWLAETTANICGAAHTHCVLTAEKATYHAAIQAVCNCLPSCTVIDYEITDTTHDDEWTYLKTTKVVKNDSRGATVELVFKNPYYTAYKATSILEMNDLISVVGGTIGLFIGLNLLSFFEIFYIIIEVVSYFTGRLFRSKNEIIS